MNRIKSVLVITRFNFRGWHKNPRIWLVFSLAFILSFMLTNKAVTFSETQGTVMQLVEAFVWTFGDSQSILLISLLLILLFADMPFLSPATPYSLSRCTRGQWLAGQLIYVLSATSIFMLFVLISTCLLSMPRSFVGNQWSETAAILGYSGAGRAVALPALVRTLERSLPYACMAHIFLLMLLYSLTLVSLMLLLNLKKGTAAGIGGAFAFSLAGFLMDPQTLSLILRLPETQLYRANLLAGWLSPLNHAAYHMHSFGYDRLPTLGQSWLVFLGLIVIFSWMSRRAIRRYNFRFSGKM